MGVYAAIDGLITVDLEMKMEEMDVDAATELGAVARIQNFEPKLCHQAMFECRKSP